MGSRWDRLLDLKSVPLVDHVLTEAARAIGEELLGPWPPPVEDPSAEFAAVFAEGSVRPPLAALLEAVRLARWDLQRDFEAYDEYVRNRRWLEKGLQESDRTALLFLSRYLLEHLLALGEATGGRVKRPDMVICLDRVERRLLPS